MRAIASYRTNKVETASKAQIVLMLFQEAVRRMDLAITGIESGDSLSWRPHLHHTREIFLELRAALDDKVAPDLCSTLRRLYIWCNDELIAAGREASTQRLKNVIRVTTSLIEGWQGALEATTPRATATP